jgi:hypothetical protein
MRSQTELVRTRRWMRLEWALLAAIIGTVIWVLGNSTFTTVAGIVLLGVAVVHAALAVGRRR